MKFVEGVQFIPNYTTNILFWPSLERVADLPKIFVVQGKMSGVRGVQSSLETMSKVRKNFGVQERIPLISRGAMDLQLHPQGAYQRTPG